MKKYLTKRNIIIALIIVAIGGYYWYQGSNSENGKAEYVTASAERGTLTTSISGSGNVIVDSSANIDPTISGTVTDLAVSIGDKVKKGQRLFTIDNDQLDVSVARALSSVRQAEISLRNARLDKDKALDDLKSGDTAGTPKRVLREENSIALDSIAQAEQSLTAARIDLQNQRSQADERNVVSPIDGTVNAIDIKNGDDMSKLSSGNTRTVPMIIGDLSTMKAQIEVNEVDVPNISIGQKVTLTFDALSGFSATGKVEKMDSIGTVVQGVVTYNVTIGFDSIDPRIKPEMSVTAAIITDVKQDVLIVPNAAVKTEGENSYVQIMGPDNAPRRVDVEVGAANNTETEIVSGLEAGDQVITQTINPGAAGTASTSSGSGLRLPGLGGGGGGNVRRGVGG